MKEKIIEIIGHCSERERAEVKAEEIAMLFNMSIVAALKETNPFDLVGFVNKIWINY